MAPRFPRRLPLLGLVFYVSPLAQVPLLPLARQDGTQLLGRQKLQDGMETWRWVKENEIAMVRGGIRTLCSRGFIYLLCLRYSPDGGEVGRSPYYKIGGTRDMRQRLRAYVTSQPFRPEVLVEVSVPDWRTAEARILKAFPRSNDLDGGEEWRRFSPAEVKKVMREMEKESQVWEDLGEQLVPLKLAHQVLQPMSFTQQFSEYDAIPNSLESIHQYAANMVLQHFLKQEDQRATVIMPEHTGLPEVGVQVVRAMLRHGMTVKVTVVITDHPDEAFDVWSASSVDGLEVFYLGRNTRNNKGYIRNLSDGRQELANFVEGHGRHKVIICLGNNYDIVKKAMEATHLTIDLMIDCNFLSTTLMDCSSLRDMYDNAYLPVRRRVCLSSAAVFCQLNGGRKPAYGGFYSYMSLQHGPVVFHLPRSAAVQRGLLRPVKIWPWTGANLERCRKAFRPKKPKDQASAVMSFLQMHPTKNMYAFLAKTEAAQELHAEIDTLSQQLGSKVKSMCVSANMTISQRYAYLELLAANESVAVSSVYILADNRSTPGVEAAFVPPWKISSLHLGKIIGLVSKPLDHRSYEYGDSGILLVLLDQTRGSEITLVLVLAALVSEDPLLINSLKQLVLLSVALGKDVPSEEWPHEIQEVVCDGCTIPRHLLVQALQIAGRSVSSDFQDWNFKAELLSAVKLREGHVQIPPSHVEAGVALGAWLQNQVDDAQQGRLDAERFDQLADVGVSFEETLDGKVLEKDEDFIKNYKQLLAFYSREGDANIEESSSWVKKQRTRCKNGKLPKAQQQLLQKLGVDLEPGKSREESWQCKVRALESFITREGHADVPGNHVEADEPLGRWLNSVRAQFKHGKLTSERAEELQALNVSLRQRSEQWEDYIEALQTFIRREGHADVPGDHIEGPLALGHWLTSQRRRALHGGLLPKQKQKLLKMKVEMDEEEAIWQCHFRAFSSRFHQLDVEVPLEGNESLRRWISSQQLKARKGKLPAARRRKLLELGMDFGRRRNGLT